MSEPDMPYSPQRVPPIESASPWWPFVFGVIVGYVIFRPGGVFEYFFPDRYAQVIENPPLAPQPPLAPIAPFARSVDQPDIDSFGFERQPRQGRTIALPPTDLFGSSPPRDGGRVAPRSAPQAPAPQE